MNSQVDTQPTPAQPTPATGYPAPGTATPEPTPARPARTTARPTAATGYPALGTATPEPTPATRTVALRRMVGSMVWDVGLAVVAYYGARALGCSDYVALLAGTVTSAARITWVAVRDRRLDAFAGFLLVLFGVGLALTFVTGDARFVLAKDSVTSGVAGLLFLGSCLIGRPLTFYAAQRFAGPAGAAELRAKAAADPAVRRRFTVMSVIWGAGLLTEALLRIPLAYLLPLDVAVGASSLLMAAAYTILIGWTIHSARRNDQP